MILIISLELRSAVHNKRRILILRVIGFQYPEPFPPYAEDLRDFLLNARTVDLDPSQLDLCLPPIRDALGPSDKVINYLKSQENFMKAVQNQAQRKKTRNFADL